MKICQSFKDRLIGNMFKNDIIDMCFPKCNSVHTFFTKKPIDIIMTDKDYNVLYVFKYIKPYRIILPKKGAYYTFEFKVNKYNYKIKDKVNFN